MPGPIKPSEVAVSVEALLLDNLKTMSTRVIEKLLQKLSDELSLRKEEVKTTSLLSKLKPVTKEEFLLHEVGVHTPEWFVNDMSGGFFFIDHGADRRSWYAKSKTGKLWKYSKLHRRWDRVKSSDKSR